jgi:hypothetical protein
MFVTTPCRSTGYDDRPDRTSFGGVSSLPAASLRYMMSSAEPYDWVARGSRD